MPILYRIERDMFEFSDVCDYMVNPVNLVGVMSAGLALEFKNKCPAAFEEYRKVCKDKTLHVGSLHVVEDTGFPWGIIHFPTKRHYMDTSSPDDIARGCDALRTMLQTPQYQYAVVGLPMLGCGCGKQDYSIVRPIMENYLSDLQATILLSMSPDRTDFAPKYLGIVGPTGFGTREDEQSKIDTVIEKALSNWGVTLSDYEGVLVGGLPGTDTYVGGPAYRTGYEKSYVYKHSSKLPLVIHPNKARNGVTASINQGKLIGEIADDLILIKPPGHNNNRMVLIQQWLKTLHTDKRKRLCVAGEKDAVAKADTLIV